MPVAHIALGANLPSPAGEPAATLEAAILRLAALGAVTRRSRLYRTRPVGYDDQPEFVNAAVELETELAPRALLSELLAVEQEFGRDRLHGIANGPRTLDLDLLLHGDAAIDEPDLHLPHSRLAERAFVLMPLAEIAPQAVEARSGRTIAALLDELRRRDPDSLAGVRPIKS